MTNEEMLAAWDRGEEIETVRMSKQSPARYERSIQTIAMEIVRYILQNPPPAWDESNKEYVITMIERVKEPIEQTGVMEQHGASEQSFGAALNLGGNYGRRGYQECIDDTRAKDPDRITRERKWDKVLDAEPGADEPKPSDDDVTEMIKQVIKQMLGPDADVTVQHERFETEPKRTLQ